MPWEQLEFTGWLISFNCINYLCRQECSWDFSNKLNSHSTHMQLQKLCPVFQDRRLRDLFWITRRRRLWQQRLWLYNAMIFVQLWVKEWCTNEKTIESGLVRWRKVWILASEFEKMYILKFDVHNMSSFFVCVNCLLTVFSIVQSWMSCLLRGLLGESPADSLVSKWKILITNKTIN